MLNIHDSILNAEPADIVITRERYQESYALTDLMKVIQICSTSMKIVMSLSYPILMIPVAGSSNGKSS